jgi:putative flavoprotein involved in K+ transport
LIEHSTTVVIGAGHAGLAASHFLTERSIDHVVLERGEVANSWRRERWDSLRLLTPNWQAQLPGLRYEGPDPDGYMTAVELTEFIERFAKASRAPVRTGVNVTSVHRIGEHGVGEHGVGEHRVGKPRVGEYGPGESGVGDRYHVTTSDGEIRCRSLVIASGACNKPVVPLFAEAVPPGVKQLTPFAYRSAGELP